MTQTKADTITPDMDIVCDLLDKVTLRHLHLMEEKICCELNIEASINTGSMHLAKSRYIMGHNSVSATKLPIENSTEFSASNVCETVEEEGVKQIKLVESNAENTINPLRWFGVLVPQNLHKAQSVFQNTVNFVVECVNIQLQLHNNLKNMEALKQWKTILNTNMEDTY